MDIDKLISEVYKRTPLWDKKNSCHHNGFVLDKLWDEVALALNTKRYVARNKWKRLREKFKTTLTSISDDTESSSYKTEWIYFPNLQFLQNQFVPKESIDNSPDNNEDCITNSSENSQNSCNINKRSASDDIGNVLEMENENYLKEKKVKMEEDDDWNFFKSIIPHIKYLTPYDKMSFRIQVLKITQEFLKHSNQSNDNYDNGNYLPETESCKLESTVDVKPIVFLETNN